MTTFTPSIASALIPGDLIEYQADRIIGVLVTHVEDFLDTGMVKVFMLMECSECECNCGDCADWDELVLEESMIVPFDHPVAVSYA